MAGRTKQAGGESGEAPQSVSAEIQAELGITPEIMRDIQAAEAAQLARWRAEPLESVKVPRNITVEKALRVIVNGCAFNLPINVEVQAPASVVAIARQRIEAAEAAEEQARARSAGG